MPVKFYNLGTFKKVWCSWNKLEECQMNFSRCHNDTIKINQSINYGYQSTINPLGVFLNQLTLKAPITTAADDKVCNIFYIFEK